MGRPAEFGKDKWKGHVRDSRKQVKKGRENIEHLRAYLKVLRQVSEGPEAAKFLDEIASTIDALAATLNSIDVEQIGLMAIGATNGERLDDDD